LAGADIAMDKGQNKLRRKMNNKTERKEIKINKKQENNKKERLKT
jgi:hypothetical protein